MKKKVLITGITGQDGFYLSKFLHSKDYEIYGLVRRTSSNPFSRYDRDIDLYHSINIIYGNMQDPTAIKRAIEIARPDEIYNLAALSDVGISFQCPDEAMEVNYKGVESLVTAALAQNPKVKIYQASTSEMFGSTVPPQHERSPFMPVSPYAEAKLRAHEEYIVQMREREKAFTCSGILFNHESPMRGENFVTRKITISLAKVSLGLQDYIELGNLNAKRDWGFAGDYVEAMWMILQQEKPDDFVIATGENHTVREFATIAAKALGMEITWEGEGEQEVGKDPNGKIIVKVNPKFYRPSEVKDLLGDSTKARTVLGWKPKTTFTQLVEMMVASDLQFAKTLLER